MSIVRYCPCCAFVASVLVSGLVTLDSPLNVLHSSRTFPNRIHMHIVTTLRPVRVARSPNQLLSIETSYNPLTALQLHTVYPFIHR